MEVLMKLKLISICLLLKNCIFHDENEVLKLCNYFNLTQKGLDIAKELANELNDNFFSFDDIKSLLIFKSDIYNFIDYESIDMLGLITYLNTLISNGKITFPYIFDNILYQRYRNVINKELTSLEYDNTLLLLDGTPIGTYQFGPYIVGKLGIIETTNTRIFIPPSSIPLWHCPVEGCNTFHAVHLSKYPQLGKIYNFFKFISNKKWDKDIDIKEDFESKIIDKAKRYLPNQLWQIPLFIGTCFSVSELRSTFKLLLDNNGRIRSLFNNNSKLNGSSDEIIKKLNKEELMQLILLFDNIEIADSIERCIDNGQIIIPDTEIRENEFVDSKLAGLLIQNIECSRYGIRVISSFKSYPINRLYFITKKIFDTPNKIKNLNWKLSSISGFKIHTSDNYSMLENVLYDINPEEFVKKILFSEHDVVEKLFEVLEFGNYVIEANEIDFLVKKVLWKLGYNITFYSEEYMTILKSFERFKLVTLSENIYTDEYKNKIRSESINLFVSLEGFLQKCLYFLTWTLLSDHNNITKFSYKEKDAFKFSFDKLNGFSFSEEYKLNLNSNGNDTLYPIIEGFSALIQLSGDVYKDRYLNIKDEAELPSGSYESAFYFPFLHKSLIQDLDEENYTRVMEQISLFYDLLNTSTICEIRNATSHNRKHEQFPTIQKFKFFFDRLDEIFKHIEEHGIYPFVYNCIEESVDRYGKVNIRAINENGREIKFFRLGDEIFDSPAFEDPHIIVPLIKLRGFDAGFILKLVNDSEFTRMKENFPNRLSR
jgi:hypothetical protein